MFSERNGFVSQILQQNDMDELLRNDIWNTFLKFYLDKVYFQVGYGDEKKKYANIELKLCKNFKYIVNLNENFFIKPVDQIENCSLSINKETIKKMYYGLKWYKVYDLIEFVYNEIFEKQEYTKEINNKLIRNNSQYRLIDGYIIPLNSEEENNSLEESLKTPYSEVSFHMSKATEFFSNREKPDYENSIKESITAVETLCDIIVGEKTSLGSALKKLEDKGVYIHPSLKGAFEKLYGYTSDAKGVRHAGNIGGEDSSFEEARFMLISCSAFINYLIDLSK